MDGRWFAEVGNVQVDSGSYDDVLSLNNSAAQPVPVVRRGFRAETFVLTCKFYWSTPCKPGITFGYLDPSNWWAVYIDSADGKARIIKRVDDGTITTVATDTNALSLTNNTWYTAKVVVEYLTTWPYPNVLSLWIDTDGDADFSDETTLLGQPVTGSVGYVGVFRHNVGTNTAQFDDVRIGTDNSSPKDGDFDDAGDEIAIDDNFNSAAITLSYDNNGNLTDDGIFKFVYDAWNRLVKAEHRSASNAATIATYAYDGAMRRQKKVVTSQGPEATPNDGGNTTIVFHYDKQWRIVEERNGSSQTVRQYVGGTQYIDEHIWIEVNGDPTIGNDTTPDVTATGEGSESPGDGRYFLHSDRSRAIVGLTNYGASTNGSIRERRSYTPTGLAYMNGSQVGGDESANVLLTSPTDNHWADQGLILDTETRFVQNRFRALAPAYGRFAQRDPLADRFPLAATKDGVNLYQSRRGNPLVRFDPSGLCARGATRQSTQFGRICPDDRCKHQTCRNCSYCPCGDNFPPNGGNWVVYDTPCSACVSASTPAPAPPNCGAPPTLPPISCCKFMQEPNYQNCTDCCVDAVAAMPPGTTLPPGWQEFMQHCLTECAEF